MKTISVTCDKCGVEMYGKDYYTLRIRSVKKGNQGMFPAFYICPKCMRELRIETLVLPIKESEQR